MSNWNKPYGINLLVKLYFEGCNALGEANMAANSALARRDITTRNCFTATILGTKYLS
jgi:hypothetical protein